MQFLTVAAWQRLQLLRRRWPLPVAVMAKDVAEAKRTVFHPRLRLAWLSALRHAIQVGCSYGAESEDIADVT